MRGTSRQPEDIAVHRWARPGPTPLLRAAVAGVLAAGALSTASFVAAPGEAAASPVGDAQAQLASIESQLATQDQQVSALDEQYDQAQLALQATKTNLFVTAVEQSKARAAAQQAEERLRQDAINAYVTDAPMIALGEVLTGAATKQDTRREYAEVIAETQGNLVDRYESSAAALQAAQARYQAEEQSEASQAAAVQSAAQAAQATSDDLQSTMNEVKGQLAVEVANQEAAQAESLAQSASGTSANANVQKASEDASLATQAAGSADGDSSATQAVANADSAVAQAARSTTVAGSGQAANSPASGGGTSNGAGQSQEENDQSQGGSPGSGGPSGAASQAPSQESAAAPSQPDPAPPASSGGSAAVAAAERYIGVPYVYGGAGPSGFDCSGLTMVAWAAAGVSLEHSAAAQYDETTHVSMSDLQPGDLIFYDFGGDGIDHVVMYVGGGTVIQAAHTGTTVGFSPIWYFDLVGAGRP